MPSSSISQSLNALPPGTVLHDYVIESELGSGGFSMVYLARHRLNSDWLFAIKEYLPRDLAVRDNDGASVHPVNTEAEDAFEDGRRRFRDEAEQLRRFRNERHVVSCLNYFEANGTAYLVMDYDDGLPLSEFLRLREEAGQPFTEADLRAVVEPLLEGLEVVHRAGVLHRDIKPGNVFVRRPDDIAGRPAQPVLIDFGAAKQNYLERHSRSRAPYTPGYAAYEQISSEGDIGPWTDIYAIGALMWRMVAGGHPGDSRLQITDESGGERTWSPTPRAAEKRAYALHRWRPDPMVPAAELGAGRFSKHLLESIDKSLALYPEDRVQNCGELQKLLKASATSQDTERKEAPQPKRAKLPSLRAPTFRSLGIATLVLALISLGIAPFLRIPLTPEQVGPQFEARNLAVAAIRQHNSLLNLAGLVYEYIQFDEDPQFDHDDLVRALEADNRLYVSRRVGLGFVRESILDRFDEGAQIDLEDLMRMIEADDSESNIRVFARARSLPEYEYLSRKEDQEIWDSRKLIEYTGIFGKLAAMVAIISDPMVFFFAGTIIAFALRRRLFAKRRGAFGRAGIGVVACAGVVAMQEVILHFAQDFRTLDVSAISVLFGATLGGLLLGGVGVFASRRMHDAVATRQDASIRVGLVAGLAAPILQLVLQELGIARVLDAEWMLSLFVWTFIVTAVVYLLLGSIAFFAKQKDWIIWLFALGELLAHSVAEDNASSPSEYFALLTIIPLFWIPSALLLTLAFRLFESSQNDASTISGAMFRTALVGMIGILTWLVLGEFFVIGPTASWR